MVAEVAWRPARPSTLHQACKAGRDRRWTMLQEKIGREAWRRTTTSMMLDRGWKKSAQRRQRSSPSRPIPGGASTRGVLDQGKY